MTDAQQRIYDVVKAIPPGKVSTYGEVARLAGVKNPRQVGWALHANPDEQNIPCHRVVNAAGRLAPNFAFGGWEEQAWRLQAEDVTAIGDKVDLKQYLWHP